MLNRMCMFFDNRKGQCLVGGLAAVGGLHLIMTSPQKVLGILPAFEMSVPSMIPIVGGKTVGAQQAVGAGLLLSGVCVLRNCM